MKCEKRLQIAIPVVLCLLLVLPVSATLGVIGIEPNAGWRPDPVNITNLSGTDFPDAAHVLVSLNMSGEESIIAHDVIVESPSKITCVFDTAGKKLGWWNVYVINTSSGEYGYLPESFSINNLAPVVTSITPDFGWNNAPVQITNLSGNNFLENAIVNLEKAGQSPILATDVDVVSPTLITCEFNITQAAPGEWKVRVNNSEDGRTSGAVKVFTVFDSTPIVSSIYPADGVNNEVIGITNLAGSGFLPGANVTLRKAGHDDIPTINGPIVESNKILCFFDLNGVPVGDWDVVVRNLNSPEGILSQGFTILYPDSPAVTGIDPPTGVNTGNVTANITGSGFYPNATILLSRGAQDITGSGGVISSGSIVGVTFDLSGMPAGTWDLTVINDDGQFATKTDAFTISNPVPTISSVDPTSGINKGWLDPTMNITGTGFIATPNVTFTKGAATFTVEAGGVTWQSSTRLTCNVNLAGKEAGDYTVTVTNPDGLSSAPFSTFTIMNPAPVVNSIIPSSGENTGAVDILALTGENFLDGARVNLTKVGETSIPGTTVAWVNSTTLTCTFNLAGAESGVWIVEVVNPDGRPDQSYVPFIITNPPPEPTSIVPSIGDNSDITAGAIIYGSGFLEDASVRLIKGTDTIPGTIVPPYTNVTTQTIPCVFNLNGAQIGPWDVVVTNMGDNLNGTLEDGFFVRYPAAPVITGISPQYGTNTGLFTISDISGTGFQQGATVNLTMSGQDSIPGTNVTVTPTHQISADFDLNGRQTGWWNVVVTNNDGQSFTYEFGFQVRYPAPTVVGITPDKGNNNQVVAITNISGTNFRSGASVRLNSTLGPDIPAGNVNVISPTKINCTLNLNNKPVGDWNVIVSNDDGQSSLPFSKFTVEYPAPTVTAINPAAASNEGVVVINSITGTNFRPGATVRLVKYPQADIIADDVHFINAQTLNCTFDIEGVATGDWAVVVVNPDPYGKSSPPSTKFEVLPPAPIPDFTATPPYGSVPLTVQFTDKTQNNPTAWIWDFGDGSTSGVLEQNPVHTFNSVGTFNVTLTVYNAGGEGTVTKEIVVVRTPVADFTASPTSGNAPMLVQFTDTSDGNPNFWTWNFGDGTISKSRNPYHLYTKPGKYSVSLTVRNAAGTHTVTKTDLISVMALPVAEFSANRTSGAAPMTVQFTDQSAGVPATWSWVFGDGATSSEQNPIHTYSIPGVYNVRLTVTNSAGTDSETKYEYISVEEGMQASFTYVTSNTGNLAPLTVAFTDTSNGLPALWFWNFGDGYISREQNPIHTYANPGDYVVTMTVTDSWRSTSTSQTIQVKHKLIADFSASPTSGSVPLTVTFTDESIGDPITWKWVIYKDQLNATVIDPGSGTEVYTFNEPGVYDVRLSVTDEYGNTPTLLKSNFIEVLPFP